jgi:hypothetical protein
MFEKAIALDPGYAEAYAQLGYIYWCDWLWQWSQDPRALDLAFEAEQKAISLDDSLPLAHMMLGNLLMSKG